MSKNFGEIFGHPKNPLLIVFSTDFYDKVYNW
jgi:hypothetical protein